MLEIKVSYLVEDFEEDGSPLHKHTILRLLGNSIDLAELRQDVADDLADDEGVYLFSEMRIVILGVSIIRGTKIDELLIDQPDSFSIKNTQTGLIPINEIKTIDHVKNQKITMSGFDFADTQMCVFCDLVSIEGRVNLFPDIKNSKISVLNIKPDPAFHYVSGGFASCLRITKSFLDKASISNVCVGSPAETVAKVFKGYKRIDNQDLLVLEDGSTIGSLDIHEVLFHGPHTNINILTDASSQILNIEISDNTKVKNRLLKPDT